MKRTELDRAFEGLARELLAAHPEVQHEWRAVGDRLDLVCGAGLPNEVFASLLGYQIALGLTTGEHEDFEDWGRGLSEGEIAYQAFTRLTQILHEHGHLTSPRVPNTGGDGT